MSFFETIHPLARHSFKQYFLYFIAISVTLVLIFSVHHLFIPNDPAIINLLINLTNNRHYEIKTNISSISLYISIHEQYKCPFYDDRIPLIAPELNRLAQLLRSFGSTIIFDISSPEKICSQELLSLQESSPGFKDLCMYDDSNSYNNYSVHHSILASSSKDYFISSPEQLIDVFSHLQSKYMIIAGIRSNLWAPCIFRDAQMYGIQPLYLKDMSDVGYYRNAQYHELITQEKANDHFAQWTRDHGVGLVAIQDFYDHPLPRHPLTTEYDIGNGYFHQRYARE